MAIKPENAADPQDYIEQIDEPRRSEIEALDRLIREEGQQLEPHIGYGMLVYDEAVALASQKGYISLYVDPDVAERYRERLPEAACGKSCIRFKRFADVDENVLRELIREASQPR